MLAKDLPVCDRDALNQLSYAPNILMNEQELRIVGKDPPGLVTGMLRTD